MIEVTDPDPHGWRWLIVGGIKVKRLRNPETIKARVREFEASPDPVKKARDMVASQKRSAQRNTEQGQVRKALNAEGDRLLQVTPMGEHQLRTR